MSVQSCLAKTKKYLKDNGLKEKVPDSKMEEFARRLEAMGADSLTPAEFSAKAKDLVDQQIKREYAAKQAEQLMVIAKREQALNSMVQNLEDWKNSYEAGKAPGNLAREVFRAWQEGGSIRPGANTNLDINLMTKSLKDHFRDVWNESIKGVKDLAAAGVIDREAFIEKYALDTNGTLGKSGSEAALEYAKGMKAVQDSILKIKQAYNPRLEASNEYLWKQFHYPDRILADPSAAGRQSWLDQVMKTYGNKSFPELTMEEKSKIFLEGYNKIADGTWGSVQDDGRPAGRGNIAQRMAHGRQWIPESPELAWEYQSKYGPPTIAEGMDRVLDSAARDVSILAKAGPQPEVMREQLFQRFLSKLDREDAQSLKAQKPQLDKDWRGLTGARNEAATGLAGKLAQGAMTWQYLAKTGASLFHVPTDIALGASLLRGVDGNTVFSNAAELALEVGKAFASTEFRNERLSEAGLFLDATHAAMMSELGAPGDDNGTFAGRFLQKIGVLNCLQRWHQSMKAGEAALLMKRIADVSDTQFTDLPSRWQQGLSRYGLTENAWNIARLGTEDIMGRKVVTPDAIRSLPDDAIENYLRKEGVVSGAVVSKQMLEMGRQDLALKMSVMLREHATLSAAEMTSRQRNFLWGDSTINEGWGVLRRLVTQFKGSSLVSYDVYRRGYFSGENMRGDLAGVAQQMLASAAIVTISDVLHQLSQGKTPEDPSQPEYAIKMLAKSGVGGIYGGVIANSFQKNGWQDTAYNIATGFGGPALQTGLESGAVGLQAAKEAMGRKQDRTLPNKAVNLAAGLVPGGSTFYIKPLLDYYIINQAHQFMGPGFLGAMERRTFQTPSITGDKQQYLFGRPSSRSFLGD